MPDPDIQNAVDQIKGLIRSKAQNIAQAVLQNTMDLAPDAIAIWIATMDSATCGACRARHRKRYLLSDILREQPLHPNCRCTYELDDGGNSIKGSLHSEVVESDTEISIETICDAPGALDAEEGNATTPPSHFMKNGLINSKEDIRKELEK